MAGIKVARSYPFPAFLRDMFSNPYKGWPGSTAALTGSGATTVTEELVQVNLGVTHGSSAARYGLLWTPNTTHLSSVNFDKEFFFAFLLKVSSALLTNETIRVQVGQNTTASDLAAHGLALQTNGANINLATYGTGGSQALVSTSVNLVTQDPIWILIWHNPATADRLFIGGVLKATQSTAANIPSTTPNAFYRPIVSILRTGGADTGDDYAVAEGFLFGGAN